MPHHPAGVEFYTVRAAALPRRLSPQLLGSLGVNALGLLEALRVLYEFRPHLVIGTGGYSSFGVLAAALLGRVPTAIHEQNALPGLVNRALAPWVGRAWCAYPETLRNLPARPGRGSVTGIPLRASVLAAKEFSRDEAKRALRLDSKRPLVLVLGGSHGARALHDALLSPALPCGGMWDVQLAVVAGRDAPRLRRRLREEPLRGPAPRVRVLSHTPRIGLWMRAADVVITRAGGTTLAELLALGAPMVVVPWPGAAEGHQEANARLLAREGACLWVPEDGRLPERLLPEIVRLLERSEERRRLAEGAVRYGRLHARALDSMLKEVERDLAPQIDSTGTTRSRRRLANRVRALADALALHRDRRGRDERPRAGAPRAGALRPRFGP